VACGGGATWSGRVVDGRQVLSHGVGRALRHPSRHKLAVSILWCEGYDLAIAYEIHPLDLQVFYSIRSQAFGSQYSASMQFVLLYGKYSVKMSSPMSTFTTFLGMVGQDVSF
jgi:hypothetical protein